MYQILIRQPWDTEWQIYNPRKTYWTKFGADRAVKKLKQSNWATERTEFKVD
jgi:hypothetical protein